VVLVFGQHTLVLMVETLKQILETLF